MESVEFLVRGFGYSCNNLDVDNNYIGKIPNKLASFS